MKTSVHSSKCRSSALRRVAWDSGEVHAGVLATILFLLLVLTAASRADAQVSLDNVPMDVLKAAQTNAANITSSPLDLGTSLNIFDGNTNSLARTANINPAFVQVDYVRPRTLTRLRVLLSYGSSYDWWIDKADTQADLDSQTGTYAVLTPTNRVVSWTWDDRTIAPVTANIFRLNVRRYGGDGYCHINEWQLFGTVLLDRLDVTPESLSLLRGEGSQFHANAYSSALEETFDLTALVQWNLTGGVGTLSSTGFFTAGEAGTGTVTASIETLSSAPATVVVQQSEPDIDVLYIERTPRLAFDPADAFYKSGLPVPGQLITYLAHVRNWGSTEVDLPFEWWFDDAFMTNGRVRISAGQEVTVAFPWNWETNSHNVEFRADPDNTLYELSKLNNRVKIRSNALLVGLWVEQSLYNYFHQTQIRLNDGANSFEDWGQRMVNRWNYLFGKAIFPVSPAGFLDRVALDKAVVVPDGVLPLAGGLAGNNPDSRDRTVDMQWGYSWDPANTNSGAFYGFRWNGPFLIDFGSIHEMNHARYHVDLYALDENNNPTHPNVPLIDDDTGQLVVGTSKMPFIAWDVVYYNKWRDIMGAGPPVFDAYSAGAWNWKHHRRGQGNQNSPPDLGRFLNDLPNSNHMQFIDQTGVPLSGAEVQLYRASGGFYNKVFDSIPAASYVADENGFIHLGRNPFGNVADFSYSSPIVIFKVRYRGELYFMFQEVTDFNIENWMSAGAQKPAADGFYQREIDLRDNPVSVPNNLWLGNYFNGENYQQWVTNHNEGTASGLDFAWTGPPAEGVQENSFSVYWQGGISFTEGWKQFQITSDGGFRLFIDGRLVFDQWANTSAQSWTPVIYTSANAPFVNPGRASAYGALHRVEARYRHSAGSAARVHLSWSDERPPADVPVNAWRADYYSTRNLNGYLLSRLETEINNHYEGGSPDPVIGSDNFSARWTGDWDFPGGDVSFTAIPDDGMRVYVDDAVVLDKWFDQPPTTYDFTRNLSRGQHRIRVEYFEGAVTAQAVLTWQVPPWFVQVPEGQVVREGADLTLHAIASGSPAPQYQWLFNKQPISGAVASELILRDLRLEDSGVYTLVISNSAGSLSVAVNLTVVPDSAVPLLSAPAATGAGEFHLLLGGAIGWTYQVQTSTNLVDWIPFTNVYYTNGPVLVVDTVSPTNQQRFYRGVVQDR